MRRLYREDFQHLFSGKRKIRTCCFFCNISSKVQGENAGVGVIVAKKNVKSSVKRNYLRRLVKETFRQNGFEHDMVIVVNKPCADLTKAQLREEVRYLWKKYHHGQ